MSMAGGRPPSIAVLAQLAFVGRSGIARYQTELVRHLSGTIDLHALVQGRMLRRLEGSKLHEPLARCTLHDYYSPRAALAHAPSVVGRLARNLDVLDLHPEACFSAVASRILMGLIVDREAFSLVHGTANFLPRTQGPTRRVVTVLDTIPLDAPEQVTRSTRHGFLKPKELRPEDELISISKAALEGALAHFDHDRGASHVIYLGIDHDLFRPLEGPPTTPAREPYLLSVGMLEPRKNLVRALAAFEILLRSHPELRWKIAGAGGHGQAEFVRALERSPARAHVDPLGPRSDEELADLYRGACVFLFPTHKEGFGIPVVEALACGTPVAASRIPAVEEAGGGAFVPLDPTSVESIVEAVERAAFDEGGRRARRAEGIEQAGKFEWGRTSEAHLEVYARALGTLKDELLLPGLQS